MKKALLFATLLPALAFAQADNSDYLQKVLRSLEQIETSSFHIRSMAYAPYDTIPSVHEQFVKAFANPTDTTLGVKFLIFDPKDTTRLLFGYDGVRKAYIEHSEKAVGADDFSTLRLPFRPVSMPFFNYAENILRYALTTSDKIETQLEENGDMYHFKLTVDEERQIEFFGHAYHMPNPSPDPRSIYEIWIRKSDGMPCRIRREMEHQTTIATVSRVSINTLPRSDWQLTDYFPTGYEVHYKGAQKNRPKPSFSILGHQAPAWDLPGTNEKNVSLGDFDGKIVLINFTGIGCGACYTAIPFLNKLTERYKPADFALAAIESWGKSLHSVQMYSIHNKLKYPLLVGTEEVVKVYLPTPAVPVFILLDRHHIVRKVFEGYSESMDGEIAQAIDSLLQESK